ncbi:hypothetical protein [Aquimarina latercula]|uniref:hypothetical protein n=1 Tax=Aquimarina latercula TaxID=987 RepID=UPI0005549845|nr:hypothetical protein [Aquimarina latercula]
MKQFVYILLLIVITSCANNSHKSMESVNVEETDIYTEEETTSTSLEDAYTILVKEKLQDYIDKQALIKNHPEFKIKKDTIYLLGLENQAEIQQIKFLEQPEILSDSITKIITEIHFTNKKIDTIISYITTSTTIIDGMQFKTSKANFERITTSKN